MKRIEFPAELVIFADRFSDDHWIDIISNDILKIKEKDAIMVGDSVESDIAGAKNAGIKAVLIDRRDRREFEDKILSLKELDKFL